MSSYLFKEKKNKNIKRKNDFNFFSTTDRNISKTTNFFGNQIPTTLANFSYKCQANNARTARRITTPYIFTFRFYLKHNSI